ncbi:MAG: adenosylcobinamide-GDP ribazoletransferase [Pyramidobacter sp.]|jgi:adenosylcobinamide-GDP ribazoletransferase
MDWLKSLCIALSTYSAVPVPQFRWTDENMACSFCFLPAVGLIIALAEYLWLLLCWRTGFNLILRTAVATALPLLLTGGIHMDGFCDTADALAAHQDAARSLEIMKDSRTGAFAVIFCAVYLLLQFGLVSEASGSRGVFCAVFVLSRAVSVLSVTGFKNARGSGMLAAFQAPARRKTVRRAAWAWIALCALFMDLCDVFAGTGALLGCIAAWHGYHATAMKRFGGITGDTSGFFIQILELSMLAGMVLGAAAEILTGAF